MTAVILFVFGTIIGSFLNVVGLRWDSKNFNGRSHCVSCNRTLKWWELIPILSFFLLRGKCSGCGMKFSWQYPIVEILTGLVFLSIYNLDFTIFHKIILLLVFCIYIVISIYDFKHKIIPDELVYTSIILSVLVPLFATHYSPLDWLAGPLLFAFFGSVWFLSRGRAMGFGDAKLGASIGFLLGAAQGFSAFTAAFWIGAAGSLIYIYLNKTGFLKNGKELTMKSEVPFAPFLILGAWISLAFNLNLFNV